MDENSWFYEGLNSICSADRELEAIRYLSHSVERKFERQKELNKLHEKMRIAERKTREKVDYGKEGKSNILPAITQGRWEKEMTNADKIRSMSDEELAKFIDDATRACNGDNDCRACPISKDGDFACNRKTIRIWLSRETKNE